MKRNLDNWKIIAALVVACLSIALYNGGSLFLYLSLLIQQLMNNSSSNSNQLDQHDQNLLELKPPLVNASQVSSDQSDARSYTVNAKKRGWKACYL